MITLKKTFKNFFNITEEFKHINLRFFDEVLNDEDVVKFDDFTDKCIDIFKSYHVRTDSIYYRPNARFDLTINKFGTTISFDNRTALSIEPIDHEYADANGYNVTVFFYMPCEKVYKTEDYNFMISNGWKASTGDVRKTNTKKKETSTVNPVLVECLDSSEVITRKEDLEYLQNVKELNENQKLKFSNPAGDSKFIASEHI